MGALLSCFYNASIANEDWILDFGKIEDGRSGIMASLFYNASTGTMLLDGYADRIHDLGKELHQTVMPLNRARTKLLSFVF